MVRNVPRNPLFYLLFYLAYLMPVGFDWYLYHRWWNVRPGAAAIFLKKRVMNEALLSYSGETYLLLWATGVLGIAPGGGERQPVLGRGADGGADPRASAFGAIKDVALTSGLAGNSLTLVMLGVAVALGGGALLEDVASTGLVRNFAIGFGMLVAVNVGVVLFQRHVMSLSPREDFFLFRMHVLRLLTGHGLVILSWMVAAPDVSFRSWLYLGAMRMVLGRMPVPNKELLFASIAAAVTGAAAPEVAAVMAIQGVMHLAGHGMAWMTATAIDTACPDAEAPRPRSDVSASGPGRSMARPK